ncbi:hypothetical protein PR048_016326 [Dryococelus australis]|uniref:Uncharacterized protein n=1 Tax=Dryococelus australis TaxID=614101 RepID=A0ABQ9HJV2_9NEOP|nr:hypothetical protein PR048_016326 [Dryococelus australis]
MTGMKPVDVKDNSLLETVLENKKKLDVHKPKAEVRDYVRISRQKGAFAKGIRHHIAMEPSLLSLSPVPWGEYTIDTVLSSERFDDGNKEQPVQDIIEELCDFRE